VPRENNAMSNTELRSFLSVVEWAALGTLSGEHRTAR
jgi:hypothetical protein